MPASKDKGPQTSAPLWKRALKRQEEWENKEEFLDIIYWMRQILSIFLGIVWGIVPLQGFLGMLLFFAVNAGVVYLYFALYQKVDEDEFGGTWELIKEGFVTSFALFLVNWIIFFTAFHFG